MAPIDPVSKNPSEIGTQLIPASGRPDHPKAEILEESGVHDLVGVGLPSLGLTWGGEHAQEGE